MSWKSPRHSFICSTLNKLVTSSYFSSSSFAFCFKSILIFNCHQNALRAFKVLKTLRGFSNNYHFSDFRSLMRQLTSTKWHLLIHTVELFVRFLSARSFETIFHANNQVPKNKKQKSNKTNRQNIHSIHVKQLET